MSPHEVVALVDDDISVRESVPDLLTDAGWVVRAFASAEAFLASNTATETHCMILDIGLPGLSGPELRGELMRRGTEAPTVFITGLADEQLRCRLLDAGAVAVLVKPFTDAALVAAVEAALRLR